MAKNFEPNSSFLKQKGWIASIKKFMIHDGPGIRTVVFMKGCPLRCKWCSSPQTWNINPEVIFLKHKCIGCNDCIAACSQGAIISKVNGRKIDYNKCNSCGKCVEICPAKALRMDGMLWPVAEVLDTIIKDMHYYRKSGGGVTISGGEPTLQSGFIVEVLKKCQEKGIHTAIETSGFTEWENFQGILKHVNLLLCDIKHMDPMEHLKLTGKSNELILGNLEKAARNHLCEIIIDFPLIPGCNDSQPNLAAMVDFFKKTNLNKIRILPFHKLGEHEYEELAMEYEAKDFDMVDNSLLEQTKGFFSKNGIEVMN